MINVSKYYKPENPDYEGNPLITVFPPLNPDRLAIVMASPIAFEASRRFEPDHLRLQYILALREFFIPQDHQSESGWATWSLMNEAYKHRNPNRPTTTAALNALCESIAAGTPYCDSDAVFLDHMWCAVLVGTPGCGKSSTIHSLLRRFGSDVLRHTLPNGNVVYQQLYVQVQPAKNSTGKMLAKQVFRALLDAALKTGETVPYANGRAPEDLTDLEHAVEVLARHLNLGALVIDELQHLYRGSGAWDEEAMKFLTGLINRLNLPLILIGTWPCLALLSLEGRIARRGYTPVSQMFCRMKFEDPTWREFLEPLFPLQYTRKPVPLNEGMSKCFYDHTQGVHDLVVKLFTMVQLEAIADGSEEITLSLIDLVAKKHMHVVAPWLSQMKNGASETDLRIYDAEPVDVERYMALISSDVIARANRAGKKKFAAPVPSSVVIRAADSLVAAGVGDVSVVQPLVEKSVAERPQDTTADHVAKILDRTKPRGPRPTRSANPLLKKENIDLFAALEDDDLRKISFFAMREKSNPADAFRARGLLVDMAKDVPY